MPRNTKTFLPGFIRLCARYRYDTNLEFYTSPARFFRTFFESRWTSAQAGRIGRLHAPNVSSLFACICAAAGIILTFTTFHPYLRREQPYLPVLYSEYTQQEISLSRDCVRNMRPAAHVSLIFRWPGAHLHIARENDKISGEPINHADDTHESRIIVVTAEPDSAAVSPERLNYRKP